MLLLIIMLFTIFYILKKNIKDCELRKKAILIFVVAFLFQSLLLLIYRIDLSSLGREVYYSDASDYWKATLAILNGEESEQYNKVYYVTCALIQKLSPFIWVGWNNIFNLLCVDISIAMSAVIIYKVLEEKQDKKTKSNTIIFLLINLFNPLINYSLMRNLKDAEFFLFVTIIGYGLYNSLSNKSMKKLIGYMISLMINLVLLMGIRPWGMLIGVVPIIILVLQKDKERYEKNTIKVLMVITIIFIVLFYSKIVGTLKMWIPIVWKSAMKRGIVSNILGIGTFLFGPGPIRAIFGEKYFQFYTNSGNIMTAIGALMWWIEIIILFICFAKRKCRISQMSYFTKYMLMFLIIYVLIYVMRYGGSLELRMRGVLYIALSSVILSIDGLKLKKSDLLISVVLLIVVILLTSIIAL